MRTSTQSAATTREDGGLRASAALASTLLLLGIGYVLLVTAPLVAQRFPSGPLGALSGAAWVPTLAASGLALGGAAALLFVLARLVLDVERELYACLAPVLAVFTAFVLVGLRVELPIAGLASEHFCALSMVLVVAGGAALQRGGVGAGLVGALLALLPTTVLLGAFAAAAGTSNLRFVVLALAPPARVFVGLLTACSLIMLALALASRAAFRVRGSVAEASPARGDASHARGTARVDASHARGTARGVSSLARGSAREDARREDTDGALWQQLRTEADAALPYVRHTSSRSVEAEVSDALDADIEMLTWSAGFPSQPTPRRAPSWLVTMAVLATLSAAGALGYRAYHAHQNLQTQLARNAAAQREQTARRASVEKAAAADRAREAAAATARLEAMLSAPRVESAPAAPSAVAAEALPAAAERADGAVEMATRQLAPSAAALAPPATAATDSEAAAGPVSGARPDEHRPHRVAHEGRARASKARRRASQNSERKARAERTEQRATRRAVSGTVNPSDDPIFGL